MHPKAIGSNAGYSAAMKSNLMRPCSMWRTMTVTIITDLFGEDSYFDDAEKFWQLQNTAIAAKKDAYLADGWSDVIIWDIGEHFASYDYVATAKDNGGKIYIVPNRNGEVTIYEGQLSRADIKKRDKAAQGETDTQTSKPELTQPMQNYLNVHRHAAVRLELMTNQGLALRLAVAQMICGSELWTIHADPQRCANDTIKASLDDKQGRGRVCGEAESYFFITGTGCQQ